MKLSPIDIFLKARRNTLPESIMVCIAAALTSTFYFYEYQYEQHGNIREPFLLFMSAAIVVIWLSCSLFAGRDGRFGFAVFTFVYWTVPYTYTLYYAGRDNVKQYDKWLSMLNKICSALVDNPFSAVAAKIKTAPSTIAALLVMISLGVYMLGFFLKQRIDAKESAADEAAGDYIAADERQAPVIETADEAVEPRREKRELGKSFIAAVTAAGSGIGKAVRTTGEKLGSAAKATSEKLGNTAKATGEKLGSAAKATGEKLGSTAKATGEKLGSAAKATSGKLGSAAGAVTGNISKTVGAMKENAARTAEKKKARPQPPISGSVNDRRSETPDLSSFLGIEASERSTAQPPKPLEASANAGERIAAKKKAKPQRYKRRSDDVTASTGDVTDLKSFLGIGDEPVPTEPKESIQPQRTKPAQPVQPADIAETPGESTEAADKRQAYDSLIDDILKKW